MWRGKKVCYSVRDDGDGDGDDDGEGWRSQLEQRKILLESALHLIRASS